MALTLMLASGRALAEPYIALREVRACGDCHVNKTGGGMRKLIVEMHGRDIMHLPNGGKGILPDLPERFSPNVNDYFSVGADFRLVDALLFQDDPMGGRVENDTAFRKVRSNDIDVDQATLYADLRLIPGYLSAYVDERVAPGGADNREAWAMLEQVLPFGAYAKAGRFFPAWGMKVQDDDAFVNSFSGFSFQRTVTGLEIGRSGEGLSWAISVAEATEDNDVDQLFTGTGSYLWKDVGPFKSLMFGASAAHDAPGNTEQSSFAGFGGLAVGPLSLVLQGIYLDDKVGSVATQSWAAYGEANWLLFGWLNFKTAFDYLDPSDDAADDEENRVSIGFEPFLDQYLQLRLFYRVYNGPENNPSANRDVLTLEAHVFF